MSETDLPAVDVPLPPQHFLGRRNVLDPICERLRQREILSSQVVGGPKSGKTSLLRFLSSSLADPVLGSAAHMVRVYVDAAALGARATPAQFWTLVCRELIAAPLSGPLLAQNAKLGHALANALERARQNTLDLFDLQDVFDNFAAMQRPVVLLADEFDTVIANPHFLPPSEFFNQVRNLNNRIPRGLAFVATTIRPLSDVGGAAAGPSPPYNHFVAIAMDPLSDDDIRAWIEWLGQRRGVQAPPEAWRRVAQVARGQPLLTSYLVNEMMAALAAGESFDDQRIKADIADPDGPFALLNQSILAALNAREQQAVQALLTDPRSVTEVQRALLQRLHKYALLPPGVEV